MNLEELTPDLRGKVRVCRTPDQILTLAKKEGYELTDEELEMIAGGNPWDEFWNTDLRGPVT